MSVSRMWDRSGKDLPGEIGSDSLYLYDENRTSVFLLAINL